MDGTTGTYSRSPPRNTRGLPEPCSCLQPACPSPTTFGAHRVPPHPPHQPPGFGVTALACVPPLAGSVLNSYLCLALPPSQHLEFTAGKLSKACLHRGTPCGPFHGLTFEAMPPSAGRPVGEDMLDPVQDRGIGSPGEVGRGQALLAERWA